MMMMMVMVMYQAIRGLFRPLEEYGDPSTFSSKLILILPSSVGLLYLLLSGFRLQSRL
jgi:hypothetical protein